MRLPLSLLCAAALSLCESGVGMAQEPVRPPPPDTMAEFELDTIPPARRRDTLRSPPADTVRFLPNLPESPRPASPEVSLGRWEWSRAELLRITGPSLLDLLERIPGVLITRSGGPGLPASIDAFGSGGGRVRVFLDGFELDPLASATFDLQQIGLAGLDLVRVVRSLRELRIELFSVRLAAEQAYSVVEAGIGTGILEARTLRGLLLQPVGRRSQLAAGFDFFDTEGAFRQVPFMFREGWLRYGWAFSPDAGVEIEMRRSGFERGVWQGQPFASFAADVSRRDLLLRGRVRLHDDLTLDAVLGRSTRTVQDTSFRGVDTRSSQAAARAVWETEPAWAIAAARLRAGHVGVASPGAELELNGGIRPIRPMLAEAGVRWATAAGISSMEGEAVSRLGPFAGVSFFGGVATGSRALGVLRPDTLLISRVEPDDETGDPRTVVDSLPRWSFPAVQGDLRGLRGGAEWVSGGFRLQGALLSLHGGTVAPHGLPFDRHAPITETEASRGYEIAARVPLLWPGLRAEAWHLSWSDTGFRPYLPTYQSRVSLVLHGLYYGGQLEPDIRLELVRRGPALVLDPVVRTFSVSSAPYDRLDLNLNIRVVDLRFFLAWENVLDLRDLSDLGEGGAGGRYPLPGQRVLYGIRWSFLN
jgi:hypothetical protein